MSSLKALKTTCEETVKASIAQKQKINIDAVDETFWQDNPVFCPYQTMLVNDESAVTVVEKGRQIGASFTYAFRAAFRATANIRDSIVTSYNKAAVKQFIKDASTWARILNNIFELITYQEIVNERELNIFEIRFLNGRTITGLAGDAVNLRSYSGRDMYLDEAAYRNDSLEDLLAAGLAAIIHGGTIRVLSTHAGVDSDFNGLIEKVKAKELPYNHIKVSFRDAIEQGLFKRICAKKKEEWTQEKEDIWIAEIYKLYGNRASEELDGIPSDYSQEGRVFNNFQYIDLPPLKQWEFIDFRYHDLAATKEEEDLNDSNYYSASVKIRYVIETGKLVIVDWTAEKLSPLEGDAKIEELALADGSKSVQLIELEPGSTGEKYVAIMQERLIKNGIFQVFGYRPTIDKVKRALPAANAIQAGELLIDENMNEKDKFTKLLRKFSSKRQPLVTDLGDCVSGIYMYIRDEYSWTLS
jgi:phage terminase large subunit-like protein